LNLGQSWGKVVAPMQDRVLAGRYRLESQLGQGGMGSVWRAEHLTLHSAVAIKLMDPAIAATPEGAERFQREAQAAASLRSTHVVQVLDYGVEDGTPFLVMELLHGESLSACLEREGRLTPTRTYAIISQVARAIARAHTAGIVHRDLKPDNIFLVHEDDQEVAKVLDFGIAKTPESAFGDMKTRTGVVMGTPHYMSPEQAEGKRTVDQRTDLWAMAVIVCECITGLQPFRGETWGELLLNVCARPSPIPSSLAAVPAGFDAWFDKATSRDQTLRFATVQELVSALRSVVEGAGAGVSLQPAGAASDGSGREGSGRQQPVVEARTLDATDPHHATTTPRRGAALGPTVTDPTLVPATVRTATSGVNAMTADRPSQRAIVPLLLVASLLTVAGLATTALVLVLRSPAPQPAAVPVPSLVETTPIVTPTPIVSATPLPPSHQPSRAVSARAGSAGTSKSREAFVAPTPSVKVAEPGATRTTAAGAGAAGRNPGKTLKCYTDPFTGIIRLEGSGPRAAGVQSYPCKQNPFTGQYQRS
jgi:serine/threonine-protein kinase